MNNTLKTWLARSAAAIATLAMIFSGAAPAFATEDGPPSIVALYGSLQVNKVTVGGDATFSFTGTGTISPFDITTTTGTGSSQINGLLVGSYTITEGSLPSGWSQTSNTCVDVTVSFDSTTTCTITNTYTPPVSTYSISGIVYNDNNTQNGLYDVEMEEGLGGWTVYLDEDESNTLNGEELSVESASNGLYAFEGLVAGCYTVREELQNDWNQTEPLEVDDFEYQVSIGGSTYCNPPTVVDKLVSMFISTANAAVNLNAANLNFGNVEKPRSGGSSSGSRPKPDDSTTTTNDEPGRVLGDSTTTPSVPLALGATLPVTGTPIASIFLAVAVLAAIAFVPTKLAVKKQ